MLWFRISYVKNEIHIYIYNIYNIKHTSWYYLYQHLVYFTEKIVDI